MAEHNDRGKEGESLAARFLEKKGYSILHKNYKYGKYEIDLVAKKEKLLVFVEVKTRTGSEYGPPESFLNKNQKQFIKRSAENYILRENWLHNVRFDVIAIQYIKNEPELVHFEDAFF